MKPSLGFWQLTLMTFSGALGAGFFVLISQAVTIGGNLVPLTFLVAAGLSFLISRVYGELATSMPASGGGQVYIRNAFKPHPLLFIVHWMTWLAELSFTALNALGFGYYLSLLLPISPSIISVLAVALLVFISLKGVGKVGLMELVSGGLLVLSLIVIFYLLFQHLDMAKVSFIPSSSEGLFGWLYAIPLIYVIFIGTEDVAAISAEVKNKKDIPRAFTVSIIGILIITVGFSFLFSHIFEAGQLAGNPQPFSLLGEAVGPFARIFGITVALLGCFSSLFFGSLADTRTAYAMSKVGEFPEAFTRLNKNKVPYVSVLTSGALVTLLVMTGSASYVAYLASAGFLIEVIFISLALIKLRQKRPHLPRPFLVKPYPMVPIMVIAISLVLLLFVRPTTWLMVFVFSIVGLLVGIFGQIKKERARTALVGVFLFLLLVGVAILLILLL